MVVLRWVLCGWQDFKFQLQTNLSSSSSLLLLSSLCEEEILSLEIAIWYQQRKGVNWLVHCCLRDYWLTGFRWLREPGGWVGEKKKWKKKKGEKLANKNTPSSEQNSVECLFFPWTFRSSVTRAARECYTPHCCRCWPEVSCGARQWLCNWLWQYT